jgi:hypothetical protein
LFFAADADCDLPLSFQCRAGLIPIQCEKRGRFVVKALEQTSFPEVAARINALYNEDDDALLLAMLGQEYVVRHEGIFLHGQKAPDSHTGVILEYVFSRGTVLSMLPWRSIGDFTGQAAPADFRKKVELPVAQYAGDVVARANTVLEMIDAKTVPSLINSDLAITVRALPKVSLHVELSQESQDFPAEVWVLFSHNANEFLSVASMQTLAEIFKERLLGLLRIY